MASIYGGALFTIAFVDVTNFRASATASSGVFVTGLLVAEIPDKDGRYPWLDCRDDFRNLHDRVQAERSRTRTQPVHLGSHIHGLHLQFNPENPESIYSWLDKTGNFPSRPEGELDSRGWAFQERLLSRRVLNITERGLFWDCLRLNACDWRPLGFRGDPSLKFRDSDQRKAKAFLFSRSALSTGTWLNPSSNLNVQARRAESYHMWRRLLQNYSSCVFTDPGDRVIAIQGIIRQMQTALDNDECVLGVWKGDVLRSLIWFVEPDDSRTLVVKGTPSITVPSWTWASVPDPIQYRLWHPFARHVDVGTEYIEPRSEVVTVSATQPDPTSFRRYKGSIVLRGPLATITNEMADVPGCQLILDPRPSGWYQYPARDRSEVPPNVHDMTPEFSEHKWRQFLPELTVMHVLEGGYSKERKAQYCLILDPVKGALESQFRRLGVLVIDANLAKLCFNDPFTCQKELCRLERPRIVRGVEVKRRCLGETRTICII